jgi:hypothetical protein
VSDEGGTANDRSAGPGLEPPAPGLAAGPPVLPDHMPLFRHLDPAAALAFRTPLQEHAPAADTKAAAILTALGIMLPLLARYGPKLAPVLWGDPHGGAATFPAMAVMTLTWLLLIGFVGLALGALVQAFYTFSPRLPNVPPSLAFFGDIAKLSREEYAARVGSMSHDEALEQIVRYNHNLASICVDKFASLRKAVKLFKGAFVCWLSLMLILASRVLL